MARKRGQLQRLYKSHRYKTSGKIEDDHRRRDGMHNPEMRVDGFQHGPTVDGPPKNCLQLNPSKYFISLDFTISLDIATKVILPTEKNNPFYRLK
jgi:hypothetical protein